MATTSVRRKPTGNTAYDASLSATDAQAELAGEDFRRDVGERLGGLNAIGALRSGGSTVAVQEAADTYGKRVSQAAAGNALSFAEMEQRKSEAALDRSGVDRRFDADLGFQRDRAGRSDYESDRGFTEDTRRFDTNLGFERERFGEDTRRFDTNLREDTRRYDQDAGESRRRFDTNLNEDTRRYDQDFGEGRRRFDEDLGFQRDRAGRSDFESDRGFTEDTRRFDYGFAEDKRRFDQDYQFRGAEFAREGMESDRAAMEREKDRVTDQRRYEQERYDAINAEKQRKKSSIWGAVGTIGGAILGGPIGAAVGNKLFGNKAKG